MALHYCRPNTRQWLTWPGLDGHCTACWPDLWRMELQAVAYRRGLRMKGQRGRGQEDCYL